MDGDVGESNRGWHRGGVQVIRLGVMSTHHHRHDTKAYILKTCRMYTVSRIGIGKKSGCVGERWVGVEGLESCRKRAQAQKRKLVMPELVWKKIMMTDVPKKG